jgi:hypothetical protein
VDGLDPRAEFCYGIDDVSEGTEFFAPRSFVREAWTGNSDESIHGSPIRHRDITVTTR